MRILPFILLTLLGATASAEDRLWTAVVIANNVAQPKEPPAELKPIVARLKRVFGCNQFEIIGTDVKPVTPNFFKTMGIPQRAGRDFSAWRRLATSMSNS